MPENTLNKFHFLVINWYINHGRSFFWRNESLNLWQWIFIEICLQRTKAEKVNNICKKLIQKYSSPYILYNIEDVELIEDLKPLGLQLRRAQSLKSISKTIIDEFNGNIPTDNRLIGISHIGNYISNAVLCFALHQKHPIIDINTARVTSRVFNYPLPSDLRNVQFETFITKLLPAVNFIEFNYGLLDIGGLFCVKEPRCSICPINEMCIYFKDLIQKT